MSRNRGSRNRGVEGGEQNPLLTGLVLIGVLALVGVVGWWVWSYSRAQTLQTPLALGAAFDVSRSVSTKQKQQAVGFLNKMIGTVLPARTPTKIWRFAESVQTVHESRPIASKELNQVSRQTIENYMGQWGTRPDKALQEFQRYIPQQPDRKFVLCLFTDGECHEAQATREVAQQLAQHPQVVAVVVGPVLDQYRASVENRYYAPLRDAGKLFVFGGTDLGDALERVKERLQTLER
ncbi:MAG: hypothetical protein KatS3mg019_0198 [Fimbriimonadales bacterium]|nr:MAG: hypothetical protein KatS3mg019_0198 [Fimbriimonadales bacterium]